MEHCFIVSIPMLHLVKEEKYHLVLPHLYKHEEYVQFYKDVQKRRETLIIQDNSIFELKKSENFDLLMRGVEEGFVDEIVVPEVLRNSVASIDVARTFVRQYRNTLKASCVRIAAVVQGKNYEEVKAHYIALKDEETLGIAVDTIHIPFNFEFDHEGSITGERRRTGIARYLLIQQLVSDGVWITNRIREEEDKEDFCHHLLGLYNPYELSLYPDDWNIRSNDSSSCYWHSLYGVRMISDVGLPYEKIEKEVDFMSYFKYSSQYDCFLYNKGIIKDFAYSKDRIFSKE